MQRNYSYLLDHSDVYLTRNYNNSSSYIIFCTIFANIDLISVLQLECINHRMIDKNFPYVLLDIRHLIRQHTHKSFSNRNKFIPCLRLRLNTLCYLSTNASTNVYRKFYQVVRIDILFIQNSRKQTSVVLIYLKYVENLYGTLCTVQLVFLLKLENVTFFFKVFFFYIFSHGITNSAILQQKVSFLNGCNGLPWENYHR